MRKTALLKKAIFLIFFIGSFFHTLYSVDPRNSISQYKLEIWKEERGLPINTVCTVLQCSDGYLWIGTTEGLARFDGVNFKLFNKSNTKEIKSNIIQALCEVHDGSLWIGTWEGGITHLKEGKFKTYIPDTKHKFSRVMRIIEAKNGVLWITTVGDGLLYFKDERFHCFNTPDNNILDICEDKSGHLWFASRKGVGRIDPNGKLTLFNSQNGLQNDIVFSVCEASDNELWIGSYGVLTKYKDGKFTHFTKINGIPPAIIYRLYVDRNRTLWAATDGAGIFRFQNNKVEILSKTDGIASNSILSICEDNQGNLWFGTLRGGLHRLVNSKFIFYNVLTEDENNNMMYIYEDSYGDIWYASQAGIGNLSRKNPNQLHTSLLENFKGFVTSILEDKNDHDFWIGTREGLHHLNNESHARFTAKEGLCCDTITCLIQDANKTIWVGTKKGLNRFENNSVFSTPFPELKNQYIITMALGMDGEPRIGTDKGLYRINGKQLYRYEIKDILTPNSIRCIYEDNEGILWLGTLDDLLMYKKGKYLLFTSRNGLYEKAVFQFFEDKNGNFWMAGFTGITVVKKKELIDFAEGKINTLQPVLYNEKDGIRYQRFKMNGCKDSNGAMWFASERSTVIVEPEKFDVKRFQAPLIIEDVKIDGESINTEHIKTGTSLIIPPGNKRLEFNYTALSFVNSEKIRFSVKLEGYDNNWSKLSTNRSISYTGLPPGKYTFKVKACNSEGVWNSTEVWMSIELKPFFYQSVWFYPLVAIVLAAIAFSFYHLRIRQLVLKEKQLSELVALRTKDLNERSLELEKANLNLHESKHIIETKNNQIISSISYAGKIQHAILPDRAHIGKFLKDYFLIYKPKDIVSGDFFWLSSVNGYLLVAVADCSGHGVPGALLSMIGNMRLNEIVNEKNIIEPGLVLSGLHIGFREILNQENEKIHNFDGMDIILCRIDMESNKIMFTGAKRPLYYIKNSSSTPVFTEIKGNRKSVGGIQNEAYRLFHEQEIDIGDEIILYLTSDGFAGQNNKDNKTFGSKRLKKVLQEIGSLDMAAQKEHLLRELYSHQGFEEQRDDIVILGIKIKRQNG